MMSGGASTATVTRKLADRINDGAVKIHYTLCIGKINDQYCQTFQLII